MMQTTGVPKVSKGAVLLATTMASFFSASMVSSINIALPSIGSEFAMNAVLLSWVVTVYPMTAATFSVPFGRIADIHGRKKVFVSGISVFTLASLLLALANSPAMLISLRILQGIGASLVFTTGVAMLISVFPPGERGKVLGINVAAVYVGLSFGPFLGGLLTTYFGWRSIFGVNVPLGVIIITTVVWKLRGGEWAEARGDKLDLVGSVIFGLTLISLIYGLSRLPAISGVWLFLAGIAGFFAFLWWEKRAASPVLNISLFRHNPVFVFSNLAALINYSATFAITFLLSLYLQYIKDFSPQHAGLILVAMPAVQAAFSPLAGRLSDKIEPRVLSSVGMALTTAGLGLLAFIAPATTTGFVLFALVIAGLGFALFSSPNTNAVMSSVAKNYYGVASGTLATMRQIGFTFSMGIAMLIMSIYIGREEITPEYYPAFLTSAKVSFTVFSALCFCGIFASLARGKVR